MDGNGRWALARGLARTAGHAPAPTVRRAVEAAPSAGIGVLTLFAFASDNWRRPGPEVDADGAARTVLELGIRAPAAEGVRLSVIGRRDRLTGALARGIEAAEAATAAGSRLWLRIAIDYSSREAIAAGALGPPVDLLIRTGGEQRLIDLLLWECAYAELFFLRLMGRILRRRPVLGRPAVRARDRRFGGAPRPPGRRAATGWLIEQPAGPLLATISATLRTLSAAGWTAGSPRPARRRG
jgi:undecaprenyl diphosphate synthase